MADDPRLGPSCREEYHFVNNELAKKRYVILREFGDEEAEWLCHEITSRKPDWKHPNAKRSPDFVIEVVPLKEGAADAGT